MVANAAPMFCTTRAFEVTVLEVTMPEPEPETEATPAAYEIEWF